MTFSIFNSYDYKNKSFALAALDKLSTPCRLAFGGKKVYVLSQTSKETSTSARVAAVFFSVLIFPIAVISISSLVIKAATLPWIWQKKNVKNQSKQAEEMIKQFNATGTYNKAIEILMKSPEIGKNPDVYENFSNIVKTKINENCSFEDIYEALPFFEAVDAMELVNQAVEVRLSNDYQNNRNFTTANSIANFIQKASEKNSFNVNTFYRKLFTNALRLNTNDDLMLKAIKMDIADPLIEIFLKNNNSNSSKPILTHREVKVLLFILIKDFNLFKIFDKPEEMKKVSEIVQNIRSMNQKRFELLGQLKELTGENSKYSQENWPSIRPEFTKFQAYLGQLADDTNDEKEKKYLLSLQELFDHMIEFVDSFSDKLSLEELKAFEERIKNSAAERAENTSVPITDIASDDFLLALHHRKMKYIADFSEEMKIFLLDNHVQLNEKLEKAS
ncbi:putative uncharacterized protein [Parachlamydia acanthamoebae UV-7]|uniref:Uncharacterized protein n=1 Tax=Parachlamydia acanthamoebae (strain UV7) TaxID=765952 RepID=F8KY92_PARAV|nr:hypothetical protein [Parachlamydia acanthamoebae]CCB85827.1 putative uncharacterized protein [Parachlamydia acanthamoebae UV-7]